MSVPTRPEPRSADPVPPAWTPPAGVTDHAGRPLAAGEQTFFAAPPREIGEILSAASTLKPGVRPGRGRWVQFLVLAFFLLFLALVGGILAMFVLVAVFRSLGEGTGPFRVVGWSGLVIWLGALVWLTRHLGESAACSFVGARGLARYALNQRPPTRPGGATGALVFGEAASLHTRQTRNYQNRRYQWTLYRFTWNDAAGKPLFTVEGVHNSEDGNPPADHPFRFAQAAEDAWSAFVLARAREQLARGEPVVFALRGGGGLAVGPGFLDLLPAGSRGGSVRCESQDIAGLTVQNGIVALRRRDARTRWLGLWSSGVYSFAYDDLANARVFLRLFAEHVGVGADPAAATS